MCPPLTHRKVFPDNAETPDSPLCLLWCQTRGERRARYFHWVRVEIYGLHWHQLGKGLMTTQWEWKSLLPTQSCLTPPHGFVEHPWKSTGCTLGSRPRPYRRLSPCMIAMMDWADDRSLGVITGPATSWLWDFEQVMSPLWVSVSSSLQWEEMMLIWVYVCESTCHKSLIQINTIMEHLQITRPSLTNLSGNNSMNLRTKLMKNNMAFLNPHFTELEAEISCRARANWYKPQRL